MTEESVRRLIQANGFHRLIADSCPGTIRHMCRSTSVRLPDDDRGVRVYIDRAVGSIDDIPNIVYSSAWFWIDDAEWPVDDPQRAALIQRRFQCALRNMAEVALAEPREIEPTQC